MTEAPYRTAAPDYQYGGMSSWIRTLILVHADGTRTALSERGDLTALGRERVQILTHADVRAGEPGVALTVLRPGEAIVVREGHTDIGRGPAEWEAWRCE